jgi:hypothetical protein
MKIPIAPIVNDGKLRRISNIMLDEKYVMDRFLSRLALLWCRLKEIMRMPTILEHTRAEFQGATVVVLFALSSVFATDGRSRSED